jgi:uncharacterized protein (DUF58 family)
MEASDILRRVRRLEFRTRRAVNEFAPGAYPSLFRGRGIEFADIREFQTGDDARILDWRATARLGHPVVKRFVEERELTLMLLVDGSASTRCVRTHERLLELAAVFAFSALRNRDRVGAMLFTTEPEWTVAPGQGRHHAQRLLRELVAHAPVHSGTDLGAALEAAHRRARRGTVFVLLSDFLDPAFDQAVRRVSLRHDLIAVRVQAQGMPHPPLGLWISLADSETGEARAISLEQGRLLADVVAEQGKATDRRLRSAGAEVLAIGENDDPVPQLARFLGKSRGVRARRRERMP